MYCGSDGGKEDCMEKEPSPQEYEDVVRACEVFDDGIHWNGDGCGERD